MILRIDRSFGLYFCILVIRYYDESVYGYVMLSFTVMVILSVLTVWGFDIHLTKLFAEKTP